MPALIPLTEPISLKPAASSSRSKDGGRETRGAGGPKRPAGWAYWSVLSLGFRPFFLVAALWGVAAVAVWLVLLRVPGAALLPAYYPAIFWHGHAMVMGFALTVIAGFLLTMLQRTTGIATLKGAWLGALVLVWLLARVLPFAVALTPGRTELWTLWLLALPDLGANIALLFALGLPVWRSRQWQQVALVGKVCFIVLGNASFYYGLSSANSAWVQGGLMLALMAAIALVLTLQRRVMPMFLKNSLSAYRFEPRNWVILDRSVLGFFVLLTITEVWQFAAGSAVAGIAPTLSAVCGAALAALLLWRLWGWYHPGIWRFPLLWSLWLALLFMALGFALLSLRTWAGDGLNRGLYSGLIAQHAWAYGGMGLAILGMMARVTLGHTGRNVFAPPKALYVFLPLLALGACVRVLLPWWWPASSMVAMDVSGFLWIAAMVLFLIVQGPMLFKANQS